MDSRKSASIPSRDVPRPHTLVVDSALGSGQVRSSRFRRIHRCQFILGHWRIHTQRRLSAFHGLGLASLRVGRWLDWIPLGQWTGAPLPLGVDCIVPMEEIGRTGKIILVSPDFEVIPKRYVHAAGSEARKGERLLALGILLDLCEDPVESAVAVRFALEESDWVIISGAVSKGGETSR